MLRRTWPTRRTRPDNDLPAFHDEPDLLDRLDVLEWIALHPDDVRVTARRDRADLLFHPQQLRATRRGRADGFERAHPVLDHVAELAVVGPMRKCADVGAEDDLHAGFDSGLERTLVALAVAAREVGLLYTIDIRQVYLNL